VRNKRIRKEGEPKELEKTGLRIIEDCKEFDEQLEKKGNLKCFC